MNEGMLKDQLELLLYSHEGNVSDEGVPSRS